MRIKSSQINREKIFLLHPNIQTELYTFASSKMLNQILNILDTITLNQLNLPNYLDSNLIRILRCLSQNNSLLVGVDDPSIANSINVRNIFIFNKNTFEKEDFGNVNKYLTLGVRTNFCD